MKVTDSCNHVLSALATAAMGYPEKYRAKYGHIMQMVLDLDNEIRADGAEWSKEEHTASMYRYGLWKKKEPEMNINLTTEDFATLAICAIRYCHGRQYMPSLVQWIIKPHLTELSDRDLSVMLHDCESMTLFDYGSPTIDRPNWERWYQELKKEKERRENE